MDIFKSIELLQIVAMNSGKPVCLQTKIRFWFYIQVANLRFIHLSFDKTLELKMSDIPL